MIRSFTNPHSKYLRFDELSLPTTSNSKKPVFQKDGPDSHVMNLDEAMKHHIESVLDLTKGTFQKENLNITRTATTFPAYL